MATLPMRRLGFPLAQIRTFATKPTYLTLPSNPWVKAFPYRAGMGTHYTLTLLPTEDPPIRNLALGTSTAFPPTPQSFAPNSQFMLILNACLAKHAQTDPDFRAHAQSTALSQYSTSLSKAARKPKSVGCFVHLSDKRKPPEYGRIAEPQDIFGTFEVDGEGNFVGRQFMPSGTYRIMTNDGVLGLSDYLMERLLEALRMEEKRAMRMMQA